MMLRLPVFPLLPVFGYVVALGGVRYRVRFTWRERVAGWYLDLLTQDGEPVVTGRRIEPQFDTLAGLLPRGRPDGVLYVRGTALASRMQLGTDVQVYFVPTAALPPEEVGDDGYRVAMGGGG